MSGVNDGEAVLMVVICNAWSSSKLRSANGEPLYKMSTEYGSNMWNMEAGSNIRNMAVWNMVAICNAMDVLRYLHKCTELTC
jgi:hypothetical protein